MMSYYKKFFSFCEFFFFDKCVGSIVSNFKFRVRMNFEGFYKRWNFGCLFFYNVSSYNVGFEIVCNYFVLFE